MCLKLYIRNVIYKTQLEWTDNYKIEKTCHFQFDFEEKPTFVTNDTTRFDIFLLRFFSQHEEALIFTCYLGFNEKVLELCATF